MVVDGQVKTNNTYIINSYDGRDHDITFYYVPYELHVSYVMLYSLPTSNDGYIKINKDIREKRSNNNGYVHGGNYGSVTNGPGWKLIGQSDVEKVFDYKQADMYGLKSRFYVNKQVINITSAESPNQYGGTLLEGDKGDDGTYSQVQKLTDDDLDLEVFNQDYEITYFYYAELNVRIIPVWR